MPRLQYGLSSYERARGDFAQLPCVNMIAEKVQVEQDGVALVSRAGLSDRSANMGTGPVQALFKRDLVLTSGLYGVSGGKLYQDTTELGTIVGSGPVSMAGWETSLFVCAGGAIYHWNGSTLSTVTFPDSASVVKVLVAASRLVAIRANTGQIYWSDVLSTTIDPLSFATAESEPDRLLDMLFIDDNLILFGSETVEIWPNTQDSPPFRPLENAVIERGVKATGCAAVFGSTFAWVTNTNQICIQSEQNVISNPGLQERIEASATVKLFTFWHEGREFLTLRLDNETQVFCGDTGTWHEMASYGHSNWLPTCFADGVFGSAVDGKTLAFNSVHTDLGGVLERRFRAGVPIDAGGFVVSNVNLRTNPGNTPYLTGDYAEPKVEMRLSRNAGKTWGDWRSRSLGAQGQYRKKVQWRACGQASQPGFLAEFRCTDPIPFRVSGVSINEPWGGR